MKKISKGFTLIELLVVIGILAILLAITLIAINPARQFAQANNTRERSDVLQILNAVHQYVAEKGGQSPPSFPSGAFTASDIGGAAGSVNLCNDVLGTYIPAIPVQPTLGGVNITTCTTTYVTGYQVARDSSGRITVSGGTDVNGAPITVTR